jgi:hypothetical protein
MISFKPTDADKNPELTKLSTISKDLSKYISEVPIAKERSDLESLYLNVSSK